ncbi:MAG TPA: SDR family oxidoreductase [Gemmatimonadaceae bacterium]|nr:SDR family oxidoreductase [Gemmatimonadaceae bacterium]
MKIVIIGGSGLIGSKVVRKLSAQGHEAIAASRKTGVNALTGEGLTEVLNGAAVVVDVSDSPSFEDAAVLDFFRTSTTNLLKAESTAGVRHHVALSVVGSDRRTDSGYMRAKIAQEKLIEQSGIPYSIVQATQFFEFMKGIADSATIGDTVRLAPVKIQPTAADDVATEIAKVAVGSPINGIVEVAGPQQFRLDELVGRYLVAGHDRRSVVADPQARYFGGEVDDRTLVPDDNATIAETKFDDWLSRQFANAPAQ